MKPQHPCCGDALCVLDGHSAGSALPYDTYWVCTKCGALWNEWAYFSPDEDKVPLYRHMAFVMYEPDEHKSILRFVQSYVARAVDEKSD